VHPATKRDRFRAPPHGSCNTGSCHTSTVSLLQLAQAIEASQIGTALRESQFWFPALILVHLIGLTIAGGTIVFWDLRLLGVGLRRAPVSKVGASLLPWTWAGFAVMFVSGSMLVTMEAGRLYSNIFFQMKMLFLILAGLNVLVFHLTVYRGVSAWDQARVAPLRARMAGGLSLLLWFSILACGRAIGYSIDYGA
jgi:hypothetical protein